MCSVEGFGILIGVMSLVLMSGLEALRKHDLNTTGGFLQNVGNTVYNSSNINILWQAPQFALIGAAEAFTSVASNDPFLICEYL